MPTVTGGAFDKDREGLVSCRPVSICRCDGYGGASPRSHRGDSEGFIGETDGDSGGIRGTRGVGQGIAIGVTEIITHVNCAGVPTYNKRLIGNCALGCRCSVGWNHRYRERLYGVGYGQRWPFTIRYDGSCHASRCRVRPDLKGYYCPRRVAAYRGSQAR